MKVGRIIFRFKVLTGTSSVMIPLKLLNAVLYVPVGGDKKFDQDFFNKMF